METVVLVVVGVLAALWIWGALQRWAAPKPRFPSSEEAFGVHKSKNQ